MEVTTQITEADHKAFLKDYFFQFRFDALIKLFVASLIISFIPYITTHDNFMWTGMPFLRCNCF